MHYTRGQMLRNSIAFCLRGIKLHLGQRFMPLKLTEEQRYDIADKVIEKLNGRSDLWQLNEPMPEYPTAPSRRAEE